MNGIYYKYAEQYFSAYEERAMANKRKRRLWKSKKPQTTTGKPSTATRSTVARIREVAVLRVNGTPWQAIAQRYGYSSKATAQTTMTQMYLHDARKKLEDGQTDVLKVGQSAVHSLLNHCAKMRAQTLKVRPGKSTRPVQVKFNSTVKQARRRKKRGGRKES